LGILGPSCSCDNTPGEVNMVNSRPSSTSSNADGTDLGVLLLLLALQQPPMPLPIH
jgi:hypothetical protein